MYSTDPLIAAIAVSVHRAEDPFAAHVRAAVQARREQRRRRWRRARTEPSIRLDRSAPRPAHDVVWLG
jgi:hypothetical protein